MAAESSERSWLFLRVDRAEAEKLLLEKEVDGTFLIRESNTGSDSAGYALSIIYQKHVYHYRILLNNEKRLHIKVKQQDQVSSFASLDDLVVYYQSTGAGLVHTLAHPAGEVASEPKMAEPASASQQVPPVMPPEMPPNVPPKMPPNVPPKMPPNVPPNVPPEMPPVVSPALREEIVDEKRKFLDACCLGNGEEVNAFLRAGAVDVNTVDHAGLSGLHWASLKGHPQVAESLLYGGAFPNLEDSEGQTPLHKSCGEGHLNVVKVLVENGAMLNRQSKDGSTSLHLSCTRGMADTLKYLLASGADPTVVNNDGDTPLHCAARLGHMICVQELLTVPDVDAKVCNNRGMTPEMCAAEGGGGGKEAVVEWLQRSKPAPSSRECSRVILCGNTGSGKSTLAQYIIDSQKSALLKAMMKFGHADAAKHPTAGVVCHTVQLPSGGGGDTLLYDLAGGEHHHSLHYAYLEPICAHTPSTFVVALDMTETNEEITRNLFYWGTFIDCVCYRCPRRSPVLVVGTHGDKLKGKVLASVLAFAKQIAQCSLKRERFVDLFTTQSGEEVSRFITLLQRTVESVVDQSPFVSGRCSSLHGFLKRVGGVVSTVSYLHLHMMNDVQMAVDAHRVIPLLRALSHKGLIVFMENDSVTFDGLVVTQKEVLLEKVVGAIFGPTGSTVGNKAGIVKLPALQRHFPNLDSDVVVEFMTHLELCLQIINVQPHVAGSEPESVLFFPDLIDEGKPSDATIDGDGFGWRMLTGTQFYTRYFFCVLLLRLVRQFSLLRVKNVKDSVPLCPQCEFWSNGVFWVTSDGMSIVVEMKDLNQLHLTVLCRDKNSLKYLAVVCSVVALVKKLFGSMCPGVTGKEFIEHRYNNVSTLVELSTLKRALLTSQQFVLDSSNKKVLLSNWKSTEPQIVQLCCGISDLQ